jgi:hypothetical protein
MRIIRLEQNAKKVGLQINTTKTKVLTQTRANNPTVQNITIGVQKIDAVKRFTVITSNCNEMEEIQSRICRANKLYYALLPILKSKHIHRFTKIRLYKTVIHPVLMYGSETWDMTKKIENIINSYERKILRSILGPINDNGTWRIRYNK